MNANKFTLHSEVILDLTHNTAAEEDVVQGKTFHKADGSVGTGVAKRREFNIAYGDTPPEDTSKLWAKCDPATRLRMMSADEPQTMCAMSPLSTELPVKWSQSGFATVGTKIYLFGNSVDLHINSNKIIVVDTETETATTLSVTIFGYLYGIAATVVGTTIYLLGGHAGAGAQTTIQMFDAETEIVTTLSVTLPTRVSHSTAQAVENKVYVFGGKQHASYQKVIMMLDTDSMTTSTMPVSFSSGRAGVASVAIGSNIYLFGGRTSDYYIYANGIYLFDTITETLTLCTTLPTAAGFCATAAIGDNVYILGGESGYGNKNPPMDTILVFNTASGELTTSSVKMSIPIDCAASAVLGTTIYVLGGYMGYINNTHTYSSTIQRYGYAVPLNNDSLGIVPGGLDNKFELMPNLHLGVDKVYRGGAYNAAEDAEAYIYKNGEWTLI